MKPLHDDDIDALLRQTFDGPTEDAGFSDRVMQRLPRRRRPSAWPLTAGVLSGAILGALSLFTAPAWRATWQAWLGGQGATSALILLSLMATMSLLALAWSLAEADDH